MKIIFLVVVLLSFRLHAQSYISLSFDDPNTYKTPKFTWKERNQKILETLKKHNLTTTLFVCGHRVNDANGKKVVESWNKAGHSIANHSWSHQYYHSAKCPYEFFKTDFLKNDSLIKTYSNYTKLFRFPFLKEGDTETKRDSMRALMKKNGYRNGSVSIDASDWYIDQRIIDTLKKNPKADLTPFKEFYIQHILDRCHYYDSLSMVLTGRNIKHVLLLHHNLLNALFLDDLLATLKKNKWALVNTKEAYADEIYATEPVLLPSGESIIWAMAKQDGRFENVLRYPAEDGVYEKPKLDMFLKNYKN